MHWRIKTKWIKQINSDFRSKGNRRDDLIITLNHGDIMVMHGAKIQEYYEVNAFNLKRNFRTNF